LHATVLAPRGVMRGLACDKSASAHVRGPHRWRDPQGESSGEPHRLNPRRAPRGP
jgi:hypothetical protein